MKKGLFITCKICSKLKYYYPSGLKRKNSIGHFCSVKCKIKGTEGLHFSKNTQFKKGIVPWNKGLKGYRAGSKNNNWKGGITPINLKIRTSTEYKFWRKSVFMRDNYACIWCGDDRGGNLEADHIKPFAYFPELRLDINNGRTLCTNCHKQTDTYAGKGCKRKNHANT